MAPEAGPGRAKPRTAVQPARRLGKEDGHRLGAKTGKKKITTHDGPEAQDAMDLSWQEVGHAGVRFKLR